MQQHLLLLPDSSGSLASVSPHFRLRKQKKKTISESMQNVSGCGAVQNHHQNVPESHFQIVPEGRDRPLS